MKFRNLLMVAGIVAAMVPTFAQASHCDSPIYVFSRTSYPGGPYPLPVPNEAPTAVPRTLRYLPGATSSAVGCNVHDVLTPDDPHEATDTDVIYPGSDTLQVRLLAHSDPTAIVSASLTFAGTTYPLTLSNTYDITGAAATFLDSQNIAIDSADTLTGNTAVATVCVVDEECYSRTYRTVG